MLLEIFRSVQLITTVLFLMNNHIHALLDGSASQDSGLVIREHLEFSDLHKLLQSRI